MPNIFDGNNWLAVFRPESGGPAGTVDSTQIDRPPSLQEMQRLVGGYVELVVHQHYAGTPFQVFVNEEGLLKNMEANIEGSLFLWRHTARRDILVGPVVVLSGKKAVWK